MLLMDRTAVTVSLVDETTKTGTLQSVAASNVANKHCVIEGTSQDACEKGLSMHELSKIYSERYQELAACAESILAKQTIKSSVLDSNDLLQEVFLVLANGTRHKFDRNCEEMAFIYGIMFNIARTNKRRNRMQREYHPADIDNLTAPESHDLLELQDEALLVKRHLGNLPVHYRHALVSQYYGYESAKDAAYTSNVTPGCMDTRRRRARLMLRKSLSMILKTN